MRKWGIDESGLEYDETGRISQLNKLFTGYVSTTLGVIELNALK